MMSSILKNIFSWRTAQGQKPTSKTFLQSWKHKDRQLVILVNIFDWNTSAGCTLHDFCAEEDLGISTNL